MKVALVVARASRPYVSEAVRFSDQKLTGETPVPL